MADEAVMRAHAASLAPLLRPGDCIGLQGDLGAGKTVFARGLIQALTGAEEVTSPTFTLVQEYGGKTPDGRDCLVTHADLYRLENEEEALALGLDEAQMRGIVLIEWPSRAPAFIDPDALEIIIEQQAETERRVTVRGGETWQKRLKCWK